jgi:hypothetical protein
MFMNTFVFANKDSIERNIHEYFIHIDKCFEFVDLDSNNDYNDRNN